MAGCKAIVARMTLRGRIYEMITCIHSAIVVTPTKSRVEQ